MARGKQKFTWIWNEKARKEAYKKRVQGLIKKVYELTILCNMSAILIFFSRDDKKLVVWPSLKVAKSLMDRFFALPDLERNIKADDQESFIKTNMKKVEKKITDVRKLIEKYEIDHLMFHLQSGGKLVDFSQSQVEKLISYSKKMIVGLEKEIGRNKENSNTCVNEPSLCDETPRASSVSSEWRGEAGFRPMGSESIYFMDKWVFLDDAKVQNDCGDETHGPTMISQVNMYDEGECSKSGGANDD